MEMDCWNVQGINSRGFWDTGKIWNGWGEKGAQFGFDHNLVKAIVNCDPHKFKGWISREKS